MTDYTLRVWAKINPPILTLLLSAILLSSEKRDNATVQDEAVMSFAQEMCLCEYKNTWEPCRQSSWMDMGVPCSLHDYTVSIWWWPSVQALARSHRCQGAKKKKGFFFFASLQTTKKQAISSMGWYHQCVGAEMCPPLVSILLGHHFFSWWKLSSGLQITNLREPFRETALPLGATELLYCIYCYPPIRLGCWRIWYFMAA